MAAASRARAVLFRGNRDTLLFVVIAAVACALLLLARSLFYSDSWLALVAGRDIWHSGVPHHDTLTTLTLGRRWVDQQWLAQLTMYGVYRVGGLALVSVLHVMLVAGSWGAAVVIGRRRGTSAALQLVILVVGALLVVQPSFVIRTQPYAYPLFIATFALLSADTRASSARVYWTLPLLVLWANVHGSAALGAALVSARGLTILWRSRRGAGGHGLAGGVLLTLGAPLCLLLTPYGVASIDYYRDTVFNPDFTSLVREWRPVTDIKPIAFLLLLLAGLCVWSMGRRPDRLTLWEKLVLIGLFLSAIMVARNVVWVAFALLMVPAIELDRVRDDGPVRARANAVLALTVATATAVALVIALTRDDREFDRGYPRAALATVSSAMASDGRLKAFTDLKYADWLLWHDPSLRGRVAYDARLELLSSHELERIVRTLTATGVDWKRAAQGSRVVVLAPDQVKEATRGFLAEPGRRILFSNADALVLLRAESQAR